MNVKKSSLIAALLICLMAGQIAYAYADDNIPHLDVSVANTTFAAGTRGNIIITIHNSGDYVVTEVEAFITSAVPGVSILSGAQKVVNSIDNGKSAAYNATVMVDQSVAVGAYLLTMTLSYLRAGRGMVTVAIPLSILVNSIFQPMVVLTVSPKKLTASGLNDVVMKVSNIAGSNVDSIEVVLSSNSPFLSIESSPNFNTATLTAGGSASFTVKVYVLESTPLGAYPLTASISYTDSNGNSLRQTATLPLEVASPIINKVPVLTVSNLDTTTAIPGERFTINARIACNDAPTFNTKATLTLDTQGMLRPMSSTTSSLGDMNAGDSQDLSFDVIVDGSAPASQIATTLTITYTDNKGAQRTVSEVLTVPVGQIVDFQLMNPKLVSVEQGATGKIDSSVVLMGTYKAQFATINVLPDSWIQLIPESSYYLGAAYPDSPVTFTLKFNVASNADVGDAKVRLQVSYLDNLNIQRQMTLEYPISVTKPAATITSDFWGWLLHLLGLR